MKIMFGRHCLYQYNLYVHTYIENETHTTTIKNTFKKCILMQDKFVYES